MAKVRGLLQNTAKDVSTMSASFGPGLAVAEHKLLHFGLAMVGTRSLVHLLGHDFRDVAKNVEDIPGLPDSVVNSVQELRHNLMGTNSELKVGIAYIESWVQKGANLLGGFLGALSTGNQNPFARQAFDEFRNGPPRKFTPDELAADRDPKFQEKLERAKEHLLELDEKGNRLNLSEGSQINALYEQYNRLLEKANDDKLDSLKKTDLLIKAQGFYDEAVQKTHQMQVQLKGLEDRDSEILLQREDLFVTKRQEVNDLTARRNSLESQYRALVDSTGQIAIGSEDKAISIKREEVLVDAQLNAALKRQGELYAELGRSTDSWLQNAIFKGGEFKDLLKDLTLQLLEVIYKQEFSASIQGGASSLFSAIGGLFGAGGGAGSPGGGEGFGAAAAGGPIDGPTLVGEHGPELIVGSPGQTVIPAGKFGSESKGGDTYIIDARSADQTSISQLFAFIRSVNGSIEMRAIAANRGYNRRAPA